MSRWVACLAVGLAGAAAEENALQFHFQIGTSGIWNPLFSTLISFDTGGWVLHGPAPFQFSDDSLQQFAAGVAADDFLLVRVTDAQGGFAQTAIKQVGMVEMPLRRPSDSTCRPVSFRLCSSAIAQ